MRTTVKRLNPDEPVKQIEDSFGFSAEVGRLPSHRPSAFCADRMDDCHRAIRDACLPGGTVRDFVSIVSDASYVHPEDSARIGDKPAVGSR